MHTHLEQWASGEQLGVWCLAQGSHLSRGQFLPEPRFEPTTSGYKSDALAIRATTAPVDGFSAVLLVKFLSLLLLLAGMLNIVRASLDGNGKTALLFFPPTQEILLLFHVVVVADVLVNFINSLIQGHVHPLLKLCHYCLASFTCRFNSWLATTGKAS